MASTSGPRGARSVPAHYEILEIHPAATQPEIKDAYKRLAILKHPDKNLGDTARACAAFQQLQTAYDILSDPTLRAKYDAGLSRGKKAAPRSEPPPPPSPRPSRSPLSTQERPPPPERTAASKARFSNLSLRAYLDSRPLRPSRVWFEISIKYSVLKQEIIRDEMSVLAAQNEWDKWNNIYDELQVERRVQDSLRAELNAMIT